MEKLIEKLVDSITNSNENDINDMLDALDFNVVIRGIFKYYRCLVDHYSYKIVVRLFKKHMNKVDQESIDNIMEKAYENGDYNLIKFAKDNNCNIEKIISRAEGNEGFNSVVLSKRYFNLSDITTEHTITFKLPDNREHVIDQFINNLTKKDIKLLIPKLFKIVEEDL